MRSTLLSAAALLAVAVPPAFAQDPPGGGGGGGGGGGMGGGGVAGVLIDPAGALTTRYDDALGGRAEKQRREAFAASNLPADLNRPSEARKVSLVALEAALAAKLAAGEEPDAAMRHLAGLTRIDALFVRPPTANEPGDLVLVGPAGGFAPDAVDRVTSTAGGKDGGRPVLDLHDLLTAFRSPPRQPIGCSIDPVPERQAAMAQAAANLGAVRSVAQAAGLYRQLAGILGEQTVRVFGVPAGSGFGVALVEADYRMKLIALGLEPSGVRTLSSHLSTIRPGANTAQRFWFVANYEPVTVNADRTAFALAGRRLRLLTEDEVIGPGGFKSDAGRQTESTLAWANRFTENVPALCEARPTFAGLQNLFDLAIAAELIRSEGLAAKAGWAPSLLADPAALPVPVGPAPKTVQTAFNTRRAGRTVVGLIGGGVSLDPAEALRTAGQEPDASGDLGEARTKALAGPPADAAVRWWWD